MSKVHLPEKVDPYRSADQAIHLKGNLPIAVLSRLRSNLVEDQGWIAIDIQFGVDEQKQRFMRGSYHAYLTLNCQRCLKPFGYELKGGFLSGLVRTDDEAEQLSANYDPFIAGDWLVLQDVIEDEILLAMPIVPKHLSKDCSVTMPYVIEATSSRITDDTNPFKVIESLRSKKERERGSE